jgi:cell division protein FtsL
MNKRKIYNIFLIIATVLLAITSILIYIDNRRLVDNIDQITEDFYSK